MMKRTCLLLLFFFALTAVRAQVLAPADLAGNWTLEKIEVVTMQGETELDRQVYTPLTYQGKIYFEKIACTEDGQVTYSGTGDQALLSEAGRFHIRKNGAMVVFQNRLKGFPFDFFWEEQAQLFVLEKTVRISQQNRQSERIRFFYQKEKL